MVEAFSDSVVTCGVSAHQLPGSRWFERPDPTQRHPALNRCLRALNRYLRRAQWGA